MLTFFIVFWIVAFVPLLARVPVADYALGYMMAKIDGFESEVKAVHEAESDDFIEVHNTIIELTALLPHVIGGLVSMKLKVEESEVTDSARIDAFQRKLDNLPGMRSIIAEIYSWMCIAHFFGAPYNPKTIPYAIKGAFILLLINRSDASEPTASGRPETVMTMDKALRLVRTGNHGLC